MFQYALMRGMLVPFALIFARATTALWKLLDPNQIVVSTWIVEWIYKPFIHPAYVWVVVTVLKMLGNFGQSAVTGFQTYLNNNPPTHHDADIIIHSVLLVIYIWILYSIIQVVRTLLGFGGRSGEQYPI